MVYLRYFGNLTNNLVKKHVNNAVSRKLHQSNKLNIPGAYEASGKTTVHVLNKDSDLGIMINGYSQVGFRLNNDFTILGSMVIFPRSVLSWNIDDYNQITEESLSLFAVIEPKIDILVIGIGDRLDNFNFFQKILPFTRKHKMSVEILPTEQACSTFNFLNSEGRNVAGAMVPPRTLTPTEDDEIHSKLRYQNLYERE